MRFSVKKALAGNAKNYLTAGGYSAYKGAKGAIEKGSFKDKVASAFSSPTKGASEGFDKRDQEPSMTDAFGKIKSGLGIAKYGVDADPYWRESAKSLAEMQARSASGTGGPSVAENVLAKALRKNMSQAQGNIRSIGGINPALRQRMLAQTGAQSGADMAEQGATLRAGEQQEAQKNLASTLVNMENMALKEQEIKSSGYADAQKRRQSFLQGLGSAFSSLA